MIETTRDIQHETETLDSFCAHPLEMLHSLNSTGGSIALTVDGNVKGLLLDPAEYEHLLEVAQRAQAEEDEALRRSEEDVVAGRTRPVDEVFDDIRRKYALSR